MVRELGDYNQCRVMKKNGYRCGAPEMVHGNYAGLGVCYIHICQAIMQSMKGQRVQHPERLVQRGMLRLVERA